MLVSYTTRSYPSSGFLCLLGNSGIPFRLGTSIANSIVNKFPKCFKKYQIHTLEISFGLGVHILKSGPKVHLVLKRGLAKDQGNVSSKQSFGIILLTNWMALTECDLEIGKHSEKMFPRAYDVPKVRE
ncbi:hypothetical protein PGT21_006475 [Puccinia graminis f. sp. tritici]|uniref:Uncharacterized protein n=1 Tax=Puccinia graminis f. sp. tritici TaxID=56615 RepID=A0A5B0MX77_PUCGR|nr:hypothetical protein PGT21_006475 [Puccinia graminis f. sp. tritici]KAA1120461.1 hypothetical protein PGTUg99_021019 [Puccinia graminis f. sp. tritici]